MTLLLLSAVYYLFQISLCADISNSVYKDKAIEYLNDAQLYYAGKDKESFFKHISDDFTWHWESDKTESKKKFMALNEVFFGHSNDARTEYIVDALGNKYCVGISYALHERGENKCKSWLFTMEIFIFNDETEIQERFSFPIDKRVYTLNNKMLAAPNCLYGKDKWDYDADDQLMEKLDNKMISFFQTSQKYYAGDIEKERLYHKITDNFGWYYGATYNKGKDVFIQKNEPLYGLYDEIDIMWEMDHFGEYYASGWVFKNVRIGECKGIFINIVIAYFDWDVTNIMELVNLPVNGDSIAEFQKCVKNAKGSQHNEL